MPRIDLNGGKATAGTTVSQALPQVKPPGRKLSNWLLTYGEYTANTECPEYFNLWVGLGTIAGALRRKVVLRTPHFDVFSNMYIILVAPPGTARKTTALKIGRSLLKDVPGVHFTTSATSPQALIQQLSKLPEAEHQSLTAYSYELGSLFAENSAGMVDLTTDLYDCNPDWDKQTIARGQEKIPRPWFNLLAATTPQWLGDYMSPTAVEGGFVSRSLYVFSKDRILKEPLPEITERHIELRRLLKNDLTHISTLSGEVTLSDEADKFYREWYMDSSRFPAVTDSRTSGYYERKHIHVLKVAMALSAAENDSLRIERRDLEAALGLLKAIEPGMKEAFSSVGRNTFATDLERILQQIRNTGTKGMPYKMVVAANYHALTKQLIDERLGELQAMGEVELKGGIYYAAGFAEA